jgi:hypothetical protein
MCPPANFLCLIVFWSFLALSSIFRARHGVSLIIGDNRSLE